MKIALISRGKYRHCWLAAALNEAGLLAKHFVQEYETQTESSASSSSFMAKYFSLVGDIERQMFHLDEYVPSLDFSSFDEVCDALRAETAVVPLVFGTSLIKGAPLSFLESKSAMNIHAGISPEYRGSACNFWAMYDGNPSLVGVTLHKLTAQVDAGDIFYAKPGVEGDLKYTTPIEYSMLQLKKGLIGIVNYFKSIEISGTDDVHDLSLLSQKSGLRKNLRISRHKDFTENVLQDFLVRWSLSI